MQGAPASPISIRTVIYLLLGLAAVLQFCRIVQVQSATGEVPFQSANDRSRWCTIAALAISGTYEIDEIIEIRDPQTRRRTWYTIDMVQHRGSDGQQHFYSSKPPLLPTLITGVYVAFRAVTGSSLMQDPFFVVRGLLVLVNLVPLLIGWFWLARWVRGEPLSEWGMLVLMAFAAFGTFLSTFCNTLNNHLPGALSVGLSVWCLDRILLKQDARWRWFAVAGVATSFGAANELPALSWLAATGAMLMLQSPRKTLLAYLPAMLPVVIGFFGTNYLAHGELSPAYGHRGLGTKLVEFRDDTPQAGNSDSAQQAHDAQAGPSLAVVVETARSLNITLSADAVVRPARRPGVFELWDAATQQRFGLQADSNQPNQWALYEWGDWYDYPGSYWTDARKQGVDRGESNRAIYVFHCLLGHHGIFSLTPFWLIALFGGLMVWRTSPSFNLLREPRLLIAAAILVTSCVAIAFYLARPLEDRNYGGVSSGFRWAFWLSGPWIWLAAQGLRCRFGYWAQRGTEVLLAVSIFSATYPWINPWTSPWLMRYWQYLRWIE